MCRTHTPCGTYTTGIGGNTAGRTSWTGGAGFFHGAARLHPSDCRHHRSTNSRRCATRTSNFCPFIQHHVHDVRAVLAPQDSLTELRTFFMHLFAEQSLAACSAICTLLVHGQCPPHIPPARTLRGASWTCCHRVYAPELTKILGANRSSFSHHSAQSRRFPHHGILIRLGWR